MIIEVLKSGSVIGIAKSGIAGVDGKSAFQVAVENGFVGTEIAWLSSLQGTGSVFVERVLDATDITNKFIILAEIPLSGGEVQMGIVGGVDQNNGIDFDVLGNVLSWNAKGYESLAEVNDVLLIKYQK